MTEKIDSVNYLHEYSEKETENQVQTLNKELKNNPSLILYAGPAHYSDGTNVYYIMQKGDDKTIYQLKIDRNGKKI